MNEISAIETQLHKQSAFFAALACSVEVKDVRRDVASAFLNMAKRRPEFLRAAFRNTQLQERNRSVEDVVIRTPARWEFEHVVVFGPVEDAYSMAGRYRLASKFIAVHPIEVSDPIEQSHCIPYFHKDDSPYRKAYVGRMELKHQLGSWRSLVSRARKSTKKRFLSHWYASKGTEVPNGDGSTTVKTMKDMSDAKLLARTGYTPEEFWREVKNPGTVTPKKPQFELSL